jgi:hypothetical protein
MSAPFRGTSPSRCILLMALLGFCIHPSVAAADEAGACCIVASCTIATEAACAGTWYGPGSVCTPNPCTALAACCTSQGICMVTSELICNTTGGTFHGATATCAPNPCQGTLGACCRPSVSCAIVEQVACTAADGTWMGNISCVPDPCASLTGACCSPSGDCQTLAESACIGAGNSWQGALVACSPDLCATPVRPSTWGQVKALFR